MDEHVLAELGPGGFVVQLENPPANRRPLTSSSRTPNKELSPGLSGDGFR
jgi:hypothetical protein